MEHAFGASTDWLGQRWHGVARSQVYDLSKATKNQETTCHKMGKGEGSN